MPRSSRIPCACGASITLCASTTALAQWVKLDIREDKTPPSPSVAAQIDSAGLGIRTFNFYNVFQGAGGDGFHRNRSLLIVSTEPGPDSPDGIAINKETVPGSGVYDKNGRAYFYQSPYGDTAPDAQLVIDDPRAAYDTYVGFGQKLIPAGGSDPTTLLPGFGFADRDGGGHDKILGGWGTPGGMTVNARGNAAFNPVTNQYENWFLQVTIVGLEPGVSLGGWAGGGLFVSEVFSGSMRIFTQGIPSIESPALEHNVTFSKVPAPGAATLLALALAATSPRRRRE